MPHSIKIAFFVFLLLIATGTYFLFHSPQGIPVTEITIDDIEYQTAEYPNGATGYAISWPQCGGEYPRMPYDFGIIGVTNGHSLSYNPCFKSELIWAQKAKYLPSFYLNLDFPSRMHDTPPRSYGYRTAQDAYEFAKSQGVEGGTWWLDVQIMSRWSSDKATNAQIVLGAIEYFNEQNVFIGLSTTPYQWHEVVGDLQTNLPNWIPGRANKEAAATYCTEGISYSGGPVLQLAYIENGFEAVYSCGQ